MENFAIASFSYLSFLKNINDIKIKALLIFEILFVKQWY